MSYDVQPRQQHAAFLKPSLEAGDRWIVDRIHVLNPIIFDSIRRNEVSLKGPTASTIKGAAKSGASLALHVEDIRQQRAALVLRRVAYVVEAHFEMTEKAGEGDNEGKHIDIFVVGPRRAMLSTALPWMS